MRDVAQMAYWRFGRRRLWIPRQAAVLLQVDIEQVPNAASRLYLADDRDAHGRRRLVVDWRTSPGAIPHHGTLSQARRPPGRSAGTGTPPACAGSAARDPESQRLHRAPAVRLARAMIAIGNNGSPMSRAIIQRAPDGVPRLSVHPMAGIALGTTVRVSFLLKEMPHDQLSGFRHSASLMSRSFMACVVEESDGEGSRCPGPVCGGVLRRPAQPRRPRETASRGPTRDAKLRAVGLDLRRVVAFADHAHDTDAVSGESGSKLAEHGRTVLRERTGRMKKREADGLAIADELVEWDDGTPARESAGC